MVYHAYGNTAYFSNRSRLSISMSVYPYVAIVKYWTKISQNAENHARNSPFFLRHVDFHLTHECLGPPHSPRQTTARSLYALPHNDATKSPFPIGYNGTPQIHPPNCPCPFDDHHQNLIHPYRARPPPQRAKRHPDPISRFATASHVRADKWD